MSQPPRSNHEWIRWGDTDPLWSVSTHEGRQRTGSNPWTDDEFYATGAADWPVFERAWSRYGRKPDGPCLEIGCGAGRLTGQIHKAFTRAVGIDVSQGMLDRAKARWGDSIEWHLTEGHQLPVASGALAGVFSTFVFQHFDRAEHGLDYFAEVARVLGPGGSCMIHVPFVKWPPNEGGLLDRTVRRALTMADQSKAAASRALAVFRRWRGTPVMRRIHYEAESLHAYVQSLGLVDVELVAIGALDLSWVFARQPNTSAS